MKPSLTLETTWLSALRAVCLGVVLLGFRPSLSAGQFGLFTYEQVGATIEITGYPQNAVGHVEIPAVIDSLPVTTIGGNAFSYCTGLTSVTIPSGVTTIHGYFHPNGGVRQLANRWPINFDEGATWGAFRGCTGLTSVTLPSSVTAIGNRAFAGCTGLTSLTLPSSLAFIDEYAFSYCTGLTNVILMQGLATIGYGIFSDCTGLTSITLPASVTSISASAFSGCTGLGSFVVEPGNTEYSSLEGVIFNAAETSLVCFPPGRAGHYSIPSGVTSIGLAAFSACAGLTSITIPSSVTSIGLAAFAGCTRLTSITLPSSVTSIGWAAFAGCTGLTSVTFPSSLTSIDDYALSDCTGLTNVTLTQGLATIGNGVFSGCTGLTSVTLPASVTSIGWSAFSGCTALTKALFLGDAPLIGPYEFSGAAPGFTIYYLSSRQGFTSPIWNGHPSTRINEATYPAALWLLTHGLGYDSDLNQDPDGDGVNLLTAYALNLDPRLNLRGRLPAPVLGADTLSLNFHASTPGIIYRVQTSTNLTHWTTTGVTQTAPGADGRSTATVLRDAPQRFLRLLVED